MSVSTASQPKALRHHRSLTWIRPFTYNPAARPSNKHCNGIVGSAVKYLKYSSTRLDTD